MAMSAVYTNFGGRIVHEKRGAESYRHCSDPLGSSVAVIDTSDSSTVYEAEYWPYGEVQTETGTNPTSLGFVGLLGYMKDLASLLYVRARHYLTSKARWLTVDPLWMLEPAYEYCFGKATSVSDPMGLQVAPSDWPILMPDDDLLFKYGRYCGAKNCDYSPGRPAPMDCIDRACQEHDDCLRQYGDDPFTFGGSICNCKLLVRANLCLQFGCYLDNKPIGGTPAIIIAISPISGIPWLQGVNRCQQAAAIISIAFGPMCLVTPITGVVQGGISLGGKLIDWVKNLF